MFCPSRWKIWAGDLWSDGTKVCGCTLSVVTDCSGVRFVSSERIVWSTLQAASLIFISVSVSSSLIRPVFPLFLHSVETRLNTNQETVEAFRAFFLITVYLQLLGTPKDAGCLRRVVDCPVIHNLLYFISVSRLVTKQHTALFKAVTSRVHVVFPTFSLVQSAETKQRNRE